MHVEKMCISGQMNVDSSSPIPYDATLHSHQAFFREPVSLKFSLLPMSYTSNPSQLTHLFSSVIVAPADLKMLFICPGICGAQVSQAILA